VANEGVLVALIAADAAGQALEVMRACLVKVFIHNNLD